MPYTGAVTYDEIVVVDFGMGGAEEEGGSDKEREQGRGGASTAALHLQQVPLLHLAVGTREG